MLYTLHLYFLSIYGRPPNFKESFYFKKFLHSKSYEELFNEMIHKVEFKKNISLC